MSFPISCLVFNEKYVDGIRNSLGKTVVEQIVFVNILSNCNKCN